MPKKSSMFTKIHFKDQLKAMYYGFINISLNFNKLAKEILNYKDQYSFSKDWSLIEEDINIAINKFKGLQNETSAKK